MRKRTNAKSTHKKRGKERTNPLRRNECRQNRDREKESIQQMTPRYLWARSTKNKANEKKKSGGRRGGTSWKWKKIGGRWKKWSEIENLRNRRAETLFAEQCRSRIKTIMTVDHERCDVSEVNTVEMYRHGNDANVNSDGDILDVRCWHVNKHLCDGVCELVKQFSACGTEYDDGDCIVGEWCDWLEEGIVIVVANTTFDVLFVVIEQNVTEGEKLGDPDNRLMVSKNVSVSFHKASRRFNARFACCCCCCLLTLIFNSFGLFLSLCSWRCWRNKTKIKFHMFCDGERKNGQRLTG